MALPSAAMNAIRPTVMRMCPRPAIPEIIADDSSPSTVRHPVPDHDADSNDHADVIEPEKRIELTTAARQTLSLIHI